MSPQTTPKWDCKDGTPDEDHDWKRISDWYGDPGVINGIADCSFRRCRVCGKEAELGDADDFYEEDYYRD